jgi:hypothetical protein
MNILSEEEGRDIPDKGKGNEQRSKGLRKLVCSVEDKGDNAVSAENGD